MTQEHPDSLFVRGVELYDTGKYGEAIDAYEQVLRQDMESAALHYNLGNAYFRDGELGEAILHYEKAKKLHPRDADIQYNLKIAKARIQDRIEPPGNSFFMRIFNGIKYWMSLNELGWLTGVLLFTGSLIFAGWWIIQIPRLQRILTGLMAVWTMLLLLVVPLLISRTLEAKQEQYGIIVQETVNAHSAPQQLSTEVFVLHEGSRVEVEDRQNQWYKIRLLDGKEGWIQANAVGII